jgi:hypothetical protein
MPPAREEMMEGHCSCNRLRYRLKAKPMIVHCCHCSWCQRESGSAFAVNAVIETDNVEMVFGEPDTIEIPSASGKGQKVVRCPHCRVALWSHYGGGGEAISFIRVGTLEDPGACPPDVHIYTSTRQDWVVLPEGARSFEGYYDPRQEWSEEGKARWKAAKAGAEA